MPSKDSKMAKKTSRKSSARKSTRPPSTNGKLGLMGNMGSRKGITRGSYSAHINYIGMPHANEGLLRKLGYFNPDHKPVQHNVYKIAANIFKEDKRARDMRTEKDVVNAIRKNETKALKSYLMRKVGEELTEFFLNHRRFNKREYKQHGALRPDRLAELREALDAHRSNILPLESRSPTPFGSRSPTPFGSRSPTPIKAESFASPEFNLTPKIKIADDESEIDDGLGANNDPEPFMPHEPPTSVMPEQPPMQYQHPPYLPYNMTPMGNYQQQYYYATPYYIAYGPMYQQPIMNYGHAWQHQYSQQPLPNVQVHYDNNLDNDMDLGYGGVGAFDGGHDGYDANVTQN